MMKRLTPLILLLGALVLFFVFGLHHHINFATLKAQHSQLQYWKNNHNIIAPLLYIFIYSLAVAISIPGGTLLTITGGFLFGLVAGTIYTVFAATLGSCGIFLATKTAFADWLRTKAGASFNQVKKGFQQNAFHYLLFLRLMPILPFWLVNIVPGLIGVRLKIFVIATVIGIIPGTFVYVSLGNSLNQLLSKQQTINLAIIFSPHILLPMIGLAILALAPILYKKWQKKTKEKHD